jgi:CRISPR system Cascade subunit CasA
MLGYRIDEKNGRLPIQFHERGLWRDFDSILPDDPDEPKLSPQVLLHAIDLTRTAPKRFPRTILALGQANDKAKIEFWRMERFELPTALAGDNDLRAEIHALLDRSEEAEKPLWQACSSFARDLISRGSRSPDRKDIRAFVDQMVPIPLYWSTLEARFHQMLHFYTLERPETEIKLQWREAVREALSQAWEKHRASVSMGDAWTLRALAKAEGPLRIEMSALNREIADLKPVPLQEEA